MNFTLIFMVWHKILFTSITDIPQKKSGAEDSISMDKKIVIATYNFFSFLNWFFAISIDIMIFADTSSIYVGNFPFPLRIIFLRISHWLIYWENTYIRVFFGTSFNYFFVYGPAIVITLFDGKHKRNPKVVVTRLIANADSATSAVSGLALII